jgi:hypothetical protein
MAVRLLLNGMGDSAKGMGLGRVGGCGLGHSREIYGTLTSEFAVYRNLPSDHVRNFTTLIDLISDRRSLFLLIFNGTESVDEHEVWGLPLSLEGRHRKR